MIEVLVTHTITRLTNRKIGGIATTTTVTTTTTTTAAY